MNTLLIALGLITLLYFLVAILKKPIQSVIKLPMCAICIAVSTTWLALLVAYFIGYSVNIMVIAILMGGSIVGIMYKLEGIFKEKKLTNFWIIRLATMLFGTTGVFLLITEEINHLVLTGILGVLFAAFSLFFVKKENNKNQKSNGFLDKMDNCC